MTRRHFLQIWCTISCLVASSPLLGQSSTTRQSVHPVLVRESHNALLRIAIDIPEGSASFDATSFEIALSGTDDSRDIDALELFYSGTKENLSTASRFDKPRKPARTVLFNGSRSLSAGRHHLWLSVRLRQGSDILHRIDANCVRVSFSDGKTIQPKDTTPGVRKRIGIALRKHGDDGVHTHRIPALTRTPKGTLLCVYDLRRRKSRDLQGDIDIGLSRSTDGGKTWESPRVIMDMGDWGGLPQEQNGCSDPGIIVDRNTGEIFCSAVWMYGKPGKHQWNGDGSEPGFEIGKSAQFLTVRSKDDGLTWSKPVNHTRDYKRQEWWLFAPSPNAGITMRDGTLVLPSAGRDKDGTPFSSLLVSRDHGATWTVSAPAFTGSSECQAVELADGSLMLNMRNERRKQRFLRCVRVTKDLGKTWSDHVTHQRALPEPNCNASLFKATYQDDGEARSVLLFANPRAKDGRHHHTLQVSFDQGKTWPASHRMLLDEGRGRGYPSITQIDAGHVGIVYEGSQADLVFEKIAIKELLTPSSR